MSTVLKFCLYIGLFFLCVFGAAFCFALIIQIMDSLGIRKPIASFLRRAWNATLFILRYAGIAILYVWAFLHTAAEYSGLFALYAIFLIIVGIFLYAAFKDADAWETVALTLALIL